jgi:hypothetical protein
MKPWGLLIGLVPSALRRARRGHKDDAKKLAKWAAWCISNDEPLPDGIKQYLIEGLEAISNGESGSKAFHTSGARGIKDRQPSMVEEILNPVSIGVFKMNEALESGEGANYHQASLIAEKFLEELEIQRSEITPGATKLAIDADVIRKAHRKKYPNQYSGTK